MRRVLAVVTVAAAVLSGCATPKKAGSGEDADEGSGGGRRSSVPRDAADEADLACARKVREEKRYTCKERPSELSEGYAARARETWQGLMDKCEGMRARYALRDFERCIVKLEAENGQLSDERRQRLEDAAPRVAELRQDPRFEHLLRLRRAALGDADAAAEDYFGAVADKLPRDELQFRKETWAEAEKALRSAEGELRGFIQKHDLDPRDAQMLGIW